MKNIAIIDGIRTAQGTLGGSLRSFSAQQLGEIVVRALIEQTKLDPKLIEEVIFGCVSQSSDAPNIARLIALKANIPLNVPAWTVQRNCASGIQAIVSAYQNIALGDANIQIVGGAESMSSSPYINRDLRFGKHLQHSMMIDSLWEGLTDPFCGQMMGQTAENLAEEFKVSKEEQDKFAVASHQKAFRATREGKFKDEITKVEIIKKARGKEMPPEIFIEDEGINIALNEQMLSLYPTVFKENGSVTPGNSCPISDGAAAVLMMSEEKAKELKYEPLGYVRSYAFAGLEPSKMGLGPTLATPIALKKAGLTLDDIELIELNEAFASQFIACEKVMKFKRKIVNVNGGGIALGHPVGATGTRIIITLLNEMKKRGLSLGLATLCVGGGQGAAVVVERR